MGSKRFLLLLAVLTAICCVVVVLFTFKDMPPYENTTILISAASAPSAHSVSSAVSTPADASGDMKKNAPSAAESGASVTAVININTADATALASLPGIGDTLSQRIIDYRNAHGPFTSTGQLDNVKGIGAKKLAALNGLITI